MGEEPGNRTPLDGEPRGARLVPGGAYAAALIWRAAAVLFDRGVVSPGMGLWIAAVMMSSRFNVDALECAAV